jgi:hypothetical protein
VFALALLITNPQFANAQEESEESNSEFISGTIAELPEGRIVVNRAVLGRPPEHRTFLITADTKIEGRLRVGARVTVRFKPSEAGDVAVRIIVRNGQQ